MTSMYQNDTLPLPVKVGDTVYFVLNDNMEPENINGWVVSHPHKVIDVSTHGFFTGDMEDFPYNADFCSWKEVEKEVFLSKKEALEEVRRRAENVSKANPVQH